MENIHTYDTNNEPAICVDRQTANTDIIRKIEECFIPVRNIFAKGIYKPCVFLVAVHFTDDIKEK